MGHLLEGCVSLGIHREPFPTVLARMASALLV